ncbi:MAG TPA: TIGR03936 family radical SAM-associated protein, partial [Polyangiaceae bacterium]|nr:TIGR03936 family radical SAM-associated protein [Polyangiaceae bacterium]
GLKLRTHDATTTVLEGILARGDRRLGPVIERAYLRGARFDSWEDQLRLDVWREALEHHAIDTAPYLGTIPVTARVPWDHLDIGLEEGFLAREYRKALAGRLSPPCGKVAGSFIHHTNVEEAEADQRRLVCYDCGIACDLSAMRNDRVAALGRLGADRPGERARLPLAPTPRADRPDLTKASGHPELYRPARTGGTPQTYRLRFAKTGPAALLGHLDLMRELPRVIRRAGMRTAYSEGFHPKPEMSFGPALSLGIASLDEYADVKLIDGPPPEKLSALLDAAASGGLRFLGARVMPAKTPSLASMINEARYAVALARGALDELGGESGLADLVREFLGKKELRVRRNIEGVGKLVDVRAFTISVTLGGHEAERALAEAGVMGRVVSLLATLKIGPSGSAKVAELVEAIVGRPGFPHQAVRVALLTPQGSPFDAAAVKVVPLIEHAG